MNRNNKNWIKILGVSVWVILSVACTHDRNTPGFDYFPDMKYSEAYDPYAPNEVTPNHSTALQPIKGTIPRNYDPYPYPKSDEGMMMAGENLHNPLDSTDYNLNRGKQEYEIFCALCHGFDGNGDGPLITSEKYPSSAPSLITEDMLARPEGEIFHVITVGSAIMGAHGSQIRPEDRWRIIMYIRSVLAQNNPEKENESE